MKKILNLILCTGFLTQVNGAFAKLEQLGPLKLNAIEPNLIEVTGDGWAPNEQGVDLRGQKGVLSQRSRVTLPLEVLQNLGLEEAEEFTWAYPLQLSKEAVESFPEPLKQVAETGAFFYFDQGNKLVAVRGVAPGEPGLKFTPVNDQDNMKHVIHELSKIKNRFAHSVTIRALKDQGADYFTWLIPNEFSNQLGSHNGGFAYISKDKDPSNFAIHLIH